MAHCNNSNTNLFATAAVKIHASRPYVVIIVKLGQNPTASLVVGRHVTATHD